MCESVLVYILITRKNPYITRKKYYVKKMSYLHQHTLAYTVKYDNMIQICGVYNS